MARFADDERMKSRVEQIKGYAPMMVFHLGTRSELRAKKNYLFHEEARERGLLQSLHEVTGTEILETSEYLSPDFGDLDAMGSSKEDDHPSSYGMRIYARAAAEAIVRRGRSK